MFLSYYNYALQVHWPTHGIFQHK